MMPKSSVVSTSPAPKSSFHMRFTVTRAVSGFSGLTVHFASASRLCGSPAGKRRQKMRRVRLNSLGARRVNAARQHMRIRDRRLLPRHQRQVAAFESLSSCASNCSICASISRHDLVDVVEVELADRMPFIRSSTASAGLACTLRYIILERQALHFFCGQRAPIEANVLVARLLRTGLRLGIPPCRVASAPACGSSTAPAYRDTTCRRHRRSIHIDLNSRGLARSVVGKEDMVPVAIERQTAQPWTP